MEPNIWVNTGGTPKLYDLRTSIYCFNWYFLVQSKWRSKSYVSTCINTAIAWTTTIDTYTLYFSVTCTSGNSAHNGAALLYTYFWCRFFIFIYLVFHIVVWWYYEHFCNCVHHLSTSVMRAKPARAYLILSIKMYV